MKKQVVKVLEKAFKAFDIKLKKEEFEKFIEIPPSAEMGDYAFPCFFLASRLKISPEEIALEIRENIGNVPREFQDIQTSGPYINFFVNRKQFAEATIKQVAKEKEKFGSVNLGNGRKILVEHTSINPNASPHVGRARNAIIGDSIVKILDFMNYRPEVHYYVNDVSKQIAMLVLAGAENLKFEDMLKKYVQISKKAEKSEQMQNEIYGILFRLEHEHEETQRKVRKITSTCVKGQKEILKRIGINYDYFDYETDFIKKSREILERLKEQETFHKERDEGRYYLDMKGTPIRKKMRTPVLVLTRPNGTGLYALRDLAYTIHKMKRSDENIVVLGEDQKLYFEQIREALKLLGSRAPRVLHYSFILLNKKGKSKKMATRKGEVVLLEDFLDDAVKKAEKEIKKRKTEGNPEKVGIAAIKYKILKNSPNKSILFDLDKALSFEGDTGPYLLYSYARASSILRKVRNKKNKSEKNILKLEPKEIDLIKKISQFPETVFKAYNELNPSYIASYSYQLAQIFNEFYHTHTVINSENEIFRISLVESFRQVLKNSLALLGIETLEKM